MKNYTLSKLFIFFLLSVAAVFFAFSKSMASNTNPMSEHKNTITQFIADIRSIQDQIFSLLEVIPSTPAKGNANLDSEISAIYSKIEDIEKKILNYVRALPKLSSQRRDILLTLIALNSVENSLFQLTQFIKTTNPVERTLLLEDFYFLRNKTTEALNKIEDSI